MDFQAGRLDVGGDARAGASSVMLLSYLTLPSSKLSASKLAVAKKVLPSWHTASLLQLEAPKAVAFRHPPSRRSCLRRSMHMQPINPESRGNITSPI